MAKLELAEIIGAIDKAFLFCVVFPDLLYIDGNHGAEEVYTALGKIVVGNASLIIEALNKSAEHTKDNTND